MPAAVLHQTETAPMLKVLGLTPVVFAAVSMARPIWEIPDYLAGYAMDRVRVN